MDYLFIKMGSREQLEATLRISRSGNQERQGIEAYLRGDGGGSER